MSVSQVLRSCAVLFLAAGCASSTPAPSTAPAADPSRDARVGLRAGLLDAGEAISNLKVTARAVSPEGFLGITNSDLAFTGNYAIQGNYNGPVIWDLSDLSNPKLVAAYTCPASQNDVSVYKNLLFMSAEAQNGRVDCLPGGVPDTVSAIRMRGVRIFDIGDIRNPRLVKNVQTCRGSHTHTVLEDPKDPDNVYIYVSGSSSVRSPNELAGCTSDSPEENSNSSLWRIEVIKVPVQNPENSAIVNRSNIFTGLTVTPAHGPSDADREAAARARAEGGFTAKNSLTGQDMVLSDNLVRSSLDSLVKERGGSGPPTAVDSAMLRQVAQTIVDRTLNAPALPGSPISTTSQCHDITVYPSLGLAGGACRGHGLLLDISDPVNPVRIDAVADSNFALWHSATFNNDGTRILFSDEWGGGRAPKCRVGDRPEWGANAIFSVENRRMKFESYYKIPTYQTSNENCVAHNGSLIPIPGRDVMVQGWYQGGISVFDWTDAAKPFEIAYFDRGPVDSTTARSGGSWSAYWYNGVIVSSEIARGLDVAELIPSQFLTQNEIDAAKSVRWTHLNAQGQPKIEWPPTFALARAFVDQLERKQCHAPARIAAIRQTLSSAERAPGLQRSQQLGNLATQLEEDVRGSCDAAKLQMLIKSVRDLRNVVVS
jgi:hypothetical protein